MEEKKAAIHALDDLQFREFTVAQFQEGRDEFLKLHEALAANTEITKKVAESTAEIVDAFAVAKKGLNFFSFIGRWLNKIARWAIPIITVYAVFWAIAHGQWPKIGGE